MKQVLFIAAVAASAVLCAPAQAKGDDSLTGATVTALIGYDHVSATGASPQISESGVSYGGALGYDFDLGRFVVGGEAELLGSSTKYSSGSLGVSAGRDIYAGVRAGVRVTGNALLYVKGGYSNAHATVTLLGATVGDDLDGYRVGGGVEVERGKWFGRVEYRYSDNGRLLGGPYTVDRNQVLLGIGYRFRRENLPEL